MLPYVTAPELRRLLLDTFRTDSEFSAFVLDYFLDTYRNFSGGMDRTTRISQLLEREGRDDVLRALLQCNPEVETKLSKRRQTVWNSSVSPPDGESLTPPAAIPVHTHAAPPQLVLHLSDVHISEDSQAEQWHTQLLLDLQKQMRIRALAGVIISGDITNHATVEQFQYAQRFIELLCKSFKIPKEKLIIVPGNHDINWKLGRDSYQPQSLTTRPESLPENMYIDPARPSVVMIRNDLEYGKRLQPFSEFYRAVCGEPYPLDSGQQVVTRHYPEINLLVMGLNSAWKIDHMYPKRAGLNPKAFGSALARVITTEAYDDCNKLAVWHHPPAELMLGGGLDGAVLQQLAQAGFRLVVHGHVHRADNPNFRYYRNSTDGGIEILTAGTFGAPSRELVPGYPFQYQVLEFGSDLLTVYTRKRNDVAGGWLPDHRWPQGANESPLASYQVRLRR